MESCCCCKKNALVGLAHIGVMTGDIEASTAFYTDVLGFELDHRASLKRGDDYTHLAFVNAGDLMIELIQPAGLAGIDSRSTDGGIVAHIAIEVKGIEEVVARLKEKGVAFDSDAVTEVSALYNGIRNIFFKGPSGEALELFEFL